MGASLYHPADQNNLSEGSQVMQMNPWLLHGLFIFNDTVGSNFTCASDVMIKYDSVAVL